VHDPEEVVNMHILILAPTSNAAQSIQAIIADPANQYAVTSLRSNPQDVMRVNSL
jgi:hypothetical protein